MADTTYDRRRNPKVYAATQSFEEAFGQRLDDIGVATFDVLVEIRQILIDIRTELKRQGEDI